jgi:NADPH:quinone reductase-like Zn-dependent oxidoreductase
MSATGKNKICTFMTKATKADLAYIKELLESGKIAPVIDRSYPLSEGPEAMRYLESGRAQGKIVITVAQ